MPGPNKTSRTPQANKNQPQPFNKKGDGHQNGHDHPPVSLKRNPMPAPTPGLDYGKVQKDEVEVLKSIFMEDYEHVETAKAWNKSNIAFKLRLKAPSDDDISCILNVAMTATYPNTPPDLRLTGLETLRPYQLATLQSIVDEAPRKLLGQEMIFEIASSIQDALEDIVQSQLVTKEKPSLDQERELKAIAAQKEAEQREEEIRLKLETEAMEKQKQLEQEIEKELRRQREHARESHEKRKPPSLEDEDIRGVALLDCVLFDRIITINRVSGAPYVFRKVSGMVKIAQGSLMSIYTVRPVLPVDQENDLPLVLKQVDLPDIPTDSQEAKRRIQRLEEELDSLRNLRHPNVVETYESKVRHTTGVSIHSPTSGSISGWEISILMEYANKGSLHDLLETVDFVGVDIARAWMISLLEALDYIHRMGAIHKGIHANNVLLFRQGFSNSTVPKFTDISYTQSLLEMTQRDIDAATSPLASARSAFWFPPELSSPENSSSSIKATRKTDIWNLGVIFLQMIFGLKVVQKYNSPQSLIDSMDISDSLLDFLERIFKADPKKRPTAFDLLPSEFLRNNDPITPAPAPSSPVSAKNSWPAPGNNNRSSRGRHDSLAGLGGLSRYTSDFTELGRLGKGGFGEVVKSRNRIDGRTYAIKKITKTNRTSLTDILSEVMLLSSLNHQYVVRYYTAWLEEEEYTGKVGEILKKSNDGSETNDDDDSDDSGTISFTESSAATKKSHLTENGGKSLNDDDDDGGVNFAASSTGGLDFISSGGYPKIQFGYDSEESDSGSLEEEVEEDDEDESGSTESETGASPKINALKRTTSGEKRRGKITLYIQMSLAERQTLRDRIRQGMNADEVWRLLHQILEGLAHIHGLGIIHRDLKPENIFIDLAGNPQIGDFGLATSGMTMNRQQGKEEVGSGENMDSDLTTDVGTTLYVAPELREIGRGKYNEKVDMYSLGVILFEMIYPLSTGMERDQVIREIRDKEIKFPSDFWTDKRTVQGSIIKELLNHEPAERPSSSELLASGKLPLKVADETIRQALQSLSDPGTPYHQQVMSALFSQSTKEYKDHTYDSGKISLTSQDLLLQSLVKERLATIFRRHGAIEASRPILFPRSKLYSRNVVQLLDQTGALVQLPYDLTLPHARSLARQPAAYPKTFTFGNVYRENTAGGQPRSHGEVDFDIVSYDSLDLALKEAEAIKVIDEVIDAFPSLTSALMCYHINHSSLLDTIMDFCRINTSCRPMAKEILSKLNFDQWTWPKIRNELVTSKLGILPTSLDDLARFDWRDEQDKAFQRISQIFEGTPSADKAQAIFAHIRAVISYLKRFGVARKVYVNPLGTWNDKFYRDGIVFQCLYDTKKRDVFAAGGRYDSLIQDHRPKMRGHAEETHAVGFNLGWEKLFTSMSRYKRNFSKAQAKKGEEENSGAWATRRTDVLVASFCSTVLRTEGITLLQELWANGINAELAVDTASPEQLLNTYRSDGVSWIVIIKQGALLTSGERNIKIKNLISKEDTELKMTDVISHLKNEIADRDKRAERSGASRTLARHSSSHEMPRTSGAEDVEMDVRILAPDRKGRKINRNVVIDGAQRTATEHVSGFLRAPIAAIDVRDEILEEIKFTTLQDPESWKKVIQNASALDRKYINLIHELIQEMATAGEKACFIYNFRTGGMVFYYLA